MIALDTHALIRILIEDDLEQAKKVKEAVTRLEADSEQILILFEVLIETVWVLEAVYRCTREEISGFLEMLIRTSIFTFHEPSVLSRVISQYRRGGDFADLVIVSQAKRFNAKKLLSFDKKLQNRFSGYVVESI